MNNNPNQAPASDLLHPFMLTVLNRLATLEAKLDGPKAIVPVGDAINTFKEYLQGNKKPQNYDFLLSRFLLHFGAERNLADITGQELATFLKANWHGNTLLQRLTEINGLWKRAIKRQRMNNLPIFYNVCELVEFQEEQKEKIKNAEDLVFIPAASFTPIIRECSDQDALIFLLPMSCGLRVSELINLRPCDIKDRVVTIWDPKSGRRFEEAWLPRPVADLLDSYIRFNMIPSEHKIFPMSRQGAYNIIDRAGKKYGLNIYTHYLRKWCATFWENEVGDSKMADCVLRHTPGGDAGLKHRYVAPLPVEEILARQDKHMGVFNQGGALCRKPLSELSDF